MCGVYISYPFCEQKCSFCNFASGVAAGDVRERYGAALMAEIDAHIWRWKPNTIYFGGGTPSLMPPELLRDLMQSVANRARVVSFEEATLECAPGTLTGEGVKHWRKCGINRVSLGVQSFAAPELRMTGRRHMAEDVARDVGLLRDAGIGNINIDLIAGLPEQTAASWDASLEWVERLGVPHVSVYVFEADEESRLGKELLTGGARYGAGRMPSDELTAELYERATERLAESGIHRYEISNFARAGLESRHNLKYWQLEPYAGFGLDAHSYDGERRWGNPDALTDYLHGNRTDEPIATDAGQEHFFLGLRLMGGIEPSPEEWVRFAGPIAKWTSVGMLEREGARLRLSPAAVLCSNEIFKEFVS